MKFQDNELIIADRDGDSRLEVWVYPEDHNGCFTIFYANGLAALTRKQTRKFAKALLREVRRSKEIAKDK